MSDILTHFMINNNVCMCVFGISVQSVCVNLTGDFITFDNLFEWKTTMRFIFLFSFCKVILFVEVDFQHSELKGVFQIAN